MVNKGLNRHPSPGLSDTKVCCLKNQAVCSSDSRMDGVLAGSLGEAISMESGRLMYSQPRKEWECQIDILQDCIRDWEQGTSKL